MIKPLTSCYHTSLSFSSEVLIQNHSISGAFQFASSMAFENLSRPETLDAQFRRFFFRNIQKL